MVLDRGGVSKKNISSGFAEGRPLRVFSYARMTLTLTLILDLDLGILKMNLYTKSEASRSRLSKFRACTGHTHRQTRLKM